MNQRWIEKQAEETDELYGQFDMLLSMLQHHRTYVRVRGFRLICALAKWDTDGLIEKNIKLILEQLQDEKPTSVRQCLAALPKILQSQPQLRDDIHRKLERLDLSRYKDTMQPLFLLRRDIDSILREL